MKGSRIVVMPMMQSRESQKTDWNMMRLNSPSLTFVSILYILFYFIQKSSISVTILNFLNPCFTCTPNFRSPREPRIFWRSILCSRRLSQNVFKKAFPGHEAGPPTYQISQKKSQRTFNACLIARWVSFSTETHSTEAHVTFPECLLKTGTWPTCVCKGDSNHKSQWAFKLSFACWSSAKAGKSFPAVSRPDNMLNRGWRWAVTRDWKPLEIENHSSVTTLDSLTNLVDLTLGPLSTWLTIQQFCGRLIASSFHETCCTRYQEENKDISKFAIDLHAYVASTICFMYSTWYESKYVAVPAHLGTLRAFPRPSFFARVVQREFP